MSSRRHIYFVESGEGGPIKIGVAIDVTARLKDLQVANPIPLRLLVSIRGDYDDERSLHRRFASERISGEWFRGDGAVRAFAVSLIGSSSDDSAVALSKATASVRLPINTPKRGQRRHYTPEQWRELFLVGNGGSIYRSAEAEAVLADREQQYRGQR